MHVVIHKLHEMHSQDQMATIKGICTWLDNETLMVEEQIILAAQSLHIIALTIP